MSSPLRLVQITDCHLGARPGDTLLGLDTDESLLDVLQLLDRQQPSVDFVVATGDITGDGSLSGYERFLDTFKRYCNKPLAWLAGNHDSDARMRSFSAAQVLRERVQLEHWQLLLLNSSVPGEEYGELAATELERLRQCLEDSDKHTLVFVHHQPVPVGCQWIDQYVIRNAPQLLELLSGYPQVKALVWGHVHQCYEGQHRHFQLLATPSTCVQFKPGSDDFALDESMPGYRWFDLHADGRFETGIERIADKAYGIDFASSGY